MNPTHQPIIKNLTTHSITIDGIDVIVTKFVEHMQDWIADYDALMGFSDVTWDNGSQVLTFTTCSVKINLLKHITTLSLMFPESYLMYDYYTEAKGTDTPGGTYVLSNGQITEQEIVKTTELKLIGKE